MELDWQAPRPVRRFARAARLSGFLMLLVWIGPVTFGQTDAGRLLRFIGAPPTAWAQQQMVPAGMALQLEPGTRLTLHLRDGRSLMGRFLGRTVLDSAEYAPRFAARAESTSYVPLALGETLSVSLRDGRRWIAPFAGYGELALLLRGPDRGSTLRTPFEFARRIQRANGDSVEAGALVGAFRAGLLPSAEAFTFQVFGSGSVAAGGESGVVHVAVEDIASVGIQTGSGAASGGVSGGQVAGMVVLGVVVAVVIVLVIIGSAIKDAENKCGSAVSGAGSQNVSELHLTTRAFDRTRGCFVGDSPLAADAWPGGTRTAVMVDSSGTRAGMGAW